MQPLPHSSSTSGASDLGNILVGWGVSPEFSEYTNEGTLVRDVQYSPIIPERLFGGAGSTSSYRVFKQSWHGYPTWPPSIATNNSLVWVSWNGATEMHSWAVYYSASEDSLGPAQGSSNSSENVLVDMQSANIVRRQGFETEIELGMEIMFGLEVTAFVKVAALNSEGRILGTTDTVRIRPNPLSIDRKGCLFEETISLLCLIRLLV